MFIRSKIKKRKFNAFPTTINYLVYRKRDFNVTHGLALLPLKPLDLPANLVLKLIIFITDPKNDIGY